MTTAANHHLSAEQLLAETNEIKRAQQQQPAKFDVLYNRYY